ncbi:MAG: class I SAM-dependent rRNA methyltransferase [Spirochaetales bacterium]|nr:class I SAM-dependent rRNA methyltransferase [Spirochaetales bacterium]
MIRVKKSALPRLLKGHPWVFDNEAEEIGGEHQPGDCVEVYGPKNRYLGTGVFNPRSRILVRIYSRRHETLGPALIRDRIKQAAAYRLRQCNCSSYRLVFAEADLLPGLMIDRYENILAVQTLSLGMDKYKDAIFDILEELFTPAAVYEKNDIKIREKEGLPLIGRVARGTLPERIIIDENSVKFEVDLEGGQKTGHFLDQRENHAAISPYCPGQKVLDICTHTGGFAVHAALYGAGKITAVDISADAIHLAERNAALNGWQDRIEFVEANAFDYLREQQGRDYGLIILDPPAFCKSKSTLVSAARGYKELNLRALKLLQPGGTLVTCSCSFHMSPEYFREVITEAAADAGRRIRLIEFRTQSRDHPILVGYPESHYLKCGIYSIME